MRARRFPGCGVKWILLREGASSVGAWFESLCCRRRFQGPPSTALRTSSRPLASPAQWEHDIALFTLAITGAIFVAVAALIIYTIIRFRRKPGDDAHQEPPQVYGSNQIEVAWTVIPILIVFVLIGVSARVIASVQNASPPASTLKVRLVGHQWWWEVQYPDYGLVTANEIHVLSSPDGKTATLSATRERGCDP